MKPLVPVAMALSVLFTACGQTGIVNLQGYLDSGEIAKARSELEAALKKSPGDALRFQTGFAQSLDGLQHLAQAWYDFGLEPALGDSVPFLRLPLPHNPNAKPISNEQARQVLEELSHNLEIAATTLSMIPDTSTVKVRINPITIQIRINGEGTNQTLPLGKLLVPLFRNQEAQSQVVCFDVGDVRWLEGYCHLLSGMANMVLAYDTQDLFEHTAQLFFAKPQTHFTFLANSTNKYRGFDRYTITDAIAFVHLLNLKVIDASRMPKALDHLESVVALSERSWDAIEKEADNDHEWIPNPKQTGTLGNPVTPEMLRSWRTFLREAKSLLAGKKLAPFWRNAPGMGVNVQRVFTQPRQMDLVLWVQGSAAAPYLEKGEVTDLRFWRSMGEAFQGRFLYYALWFN